jgi:hypothetical protein
MVKIEITGCIMKLSQDLRTAVFDIDCLSVYLFNGNHRIIATEQMKGKSFPDIYNICNDWVRNGKYNESDFAA